jgi:hypothetical protein
MKGYELLTSLYSEMEAQIIKEKLADAGIESFMQHSDSIGISATLDSIKGIKIFVQPYDLEKAMWLITDAKDDLTDDMEIGVGD